MARSKVLTIGVAQMRVTAHIGRNLAEIFHFCEMARDAKADLICFPECALTGYGPRHYESSAEFDPDAVEAAVAEVRGVAREMKLAIVLGAHLPQESGWTNSTLLIGPNGRVRSQYDKAHLFGRDLEFYRAGRALPETATINGVRFGMQICFDARFPELFRVLALDRAQVIFVPSFIHGKKNMWKQAVFEAHIGSRAAENGRFVVFANPSGPEENVPCMVANPAGIIVAKCRRGPRQFLLTRLDLSEVNDDFISCRRKDLYKLRP